MPECAKISSEKRLLAMEEAVPTLKGSSRFLRFAVPYIMNFFMRKVDLVFPWLEDYAAALPEKERREGRMVAAVLKCIFAGNAFELQQEIIASYIGMEYKERNGKKGDILECARQELIQRFRDKKFFRKPRIFRKDLRRWGV